jgi:aarF domain-containing kinase
MYTVTELGPAFVKLCQWIATRRDIFPPHICDRLAQLHDRGTCHDWSYTHQALVNSFGPNYEQNGLHIDHDVDNKLIGIIGCGSAAQVYKGTLNVYNPVNGEIEETRPVAIKVLHPKFQYRVERDMWLLESVVDLIHTHVPSDYIKMLNLPRAARNFGTLLRLQSDLRCEADNLNEFRTNFYGTGTEQESSIFFPKPVDGWITKDILVEQLVEDAVPISEYLRDNANNRAGVGEEDIITTSIRKELAVPLLNAFLKMVFLDNFVHCGKWS